MDLLKGSSSYSIHFSPERSKLEKDIAKQEKKAKQVLRRAALSNSDQLLDREMLKEVINESQQRWLGCLMLPVTIMYFTFYSIAASLHEDVTNSHLLEAPIRSKLVPSLADDEDPTPDMLQGVSTIPEVYGFIENTYLPLFFKQTDDLGNPLPRDQWSTIYQYSRVEGLVILELERGPKVRCKDDFAQNLWCYPTDQGNSVENFGMPWDMMPHGADYYYNGTDPILGCEHEGFSVTGCPGVSRRLTLLRDDLTPKVPQERDDGDGSVKYRFVFDPNTTYARVMARLQYLKDRQWLDEQSTVLVLKAYVLNNQIEVPRLMNIIIRFHFSRGGGVFSTINFQGVALTTFISWASILFDVLFVLMLLASTAFLARDICKAMMARVPRSHFSFVNIISWISVVVGWGNTIVVLRSTAWRDSIRSDLAAYMSWPSQTNALAFADTADTVGEMMEYVRISVAFLHIFFMIRCFISLKWQPRLEVVTRTIYVMANDLFHFMIVMIPTFLAFAIAGMMIFGRRLQDWSTIQAALSTCFKIAMESEFRWDSMSAQDFWTSALWVWTFVPLVVLLLLNMVLAIIMDIYQQVRSGVGNTMTIPAHLEYIWNVFRHRRTWISYPALYSKVSNMPQTISILELRQAFPSMPDYQGAYLVKECFNKAKQIARVGVDPSVIEQMVAAIHVSLGEVQHDIKEMKRRGWLGVGFEVGNANEREVIKEILTSVATQQHWMTLTQKSMNVLQARINNMDEDTSPQGNIKAELHASGLVIDG